jgi:hypothetical protein
MFHLELRQFPHNHCQFNLTDEELGAIAEPWASGQWVELGQRKWSPYQAKLKIIEGPPIRMHQLSMGRGWRHVERHGEDVTGRVLDAASASLATAQAALVGPRSGPAAGAAASHPLHDSDASLDELRSLLGGTPRAEALLAVWRYTAARFPDRTPSECLALAERQLDSPVDEPGRARPLDG